VVCDFGRLWVTSLDDRQSPAWLDATARRCWSGTSDEPCLTVSARGSIVASGPSVARHYVWYAGCDPLLRGSFQAGGQPAHALFGSRPDCPWVTTNDRSFPPSPARKWHGACWSCALEAAGGIVDLVSSKTALSPPTRSAPQDGQAPAQVWPGCRRFAASASS